mmetsp:Transcript_73456/g.129455  ORF Transcript_73456/g.129455 Transcript_73456/m.129455 type:complete len:92 (-) Transcript_73456:394-669(-)
MRKHGSKPLNDWTPQKSKCSPPTPNDHHTVLTGRRTIAANPQVSTCNVGGKSPNQSAWCSACIITVKPTGSGDSQRSWRFKTSPCVWDCNT